MQRLTGKQEAFAREVGHVESENGGAVYHRLTQQTKCEQ